MNTKSFAIIVILSACFNLQAQIACNFHAKNCFYLEVGGIGGYGSINYERIYFLKNNFRYGFRAGISTVNIKDFTNKLNPDIIIPFTFNGLYGKEHQVELGAGEAITNIVHENTANRKRERKTNLNAVFSIGYRYQKASGGLIFRCSYTPVIQFYQFYRHWGGLTVGYAF